MVGVGEGHSPFEIVTPVRARAAIAAAVFCDHGRTGSKQLGAVMLHAHQRDAVSRLGEAMSEFGGAVLCDPVGTGKTFIALALIPESSTALVVAPAVLRPMWFTAAQRASRSIRFTSFEALSRGAVETHAHDLLIVDEAHHARNPATRRFGVLSRLVNGKPVLLLSATPIHNRKKDLTMLLSLFIGNRAAELTAAELSRCVLRRDHAGLTSAAIPRVERLKWLTVAENKNVAQMILALPPPLPPSDGGDGGALVAHSLIRQWASSDGALHCALMRRLRKAVALIAALEDGTYPSRSELGAWIGYEDSVQLVFSPLVASATGIAATLLPVVRTHHDALAKLLHEAREDTRDNERAAIIRRLRKRHDGSRIVAFTQFAETVDTMFARLAAGGGVAALTGSGARVAGGTLSRNEAIERFAPTASGHAAPSRADEITLLITTDLLSEGVNLQDASVVIHLDLPWTPARMEQRLGRIARIGSLHETVFAYAFRPPASTNDVLRIERILRNKMSEASIVTAEFPSLMDDGVSRAERSQPAIMESISETVLRWMPDEPARRPSAKPLLSVVGAPADGFLAAFGNGDEARLIASVNGTISDDPEVVLECVRSCAGPAVSADATECLTAVSAIHSYLEAESALTGVHTTCRRTAVRTDALRRISLSVQRARPHERATITSLAAHARAALRQNLGIEAERQLGVLCRTEMDDRAWLGQVTDQLSLLQSRKPKSYCDGSLIALIVFRACDDAIALSHATER